MEMICMKKETFLLVLLSVFLTSCGLSRESVNSPQVFHTMSTTPISVVTSAETATFTPLPTATIIPMQTPLPTLNSQNPSLTVKGLLETITNCVLPCWWGVVPGKTYWEDAYNSLLPIANNIYESTPGNSELMTVAMFFPAPNPSPGEFRQVFHIKNDIVERIEILPQHFSKYSLPRGLLQEFGNPEKIFLGGSIEQPQSFQLILYYPNRGIFALYSNELRPFQQQEVVDVCFTEDEIKYVDMFLWDPANSFSETLNHIFTEYERPFYDIEIVTDMTISEFSNLFASTNQSGCCQTSSSFWHN
jgi:hypothetical protein